MASNKGTSGDDVIKGKDFTDLLFGFAGDDKLYGNGGMDVIEGGKGSDILEGGDGRDTFVFGVGSLSQNPKKAFTDTIRDFTPGKDMLLIEKGINGIKSADDVLKHATNTDKGLEIDLGDGNKIILKGVTKADLKDDPSAHFDVSKFD